MVIVRVMVMVIVIVIAPRRRGPRWWISTLNKNNLRKTRELAKHWVFLISMLILVSTLEAEVRPSQSESSLCLLLDAENLERCKR